MPLKKTRKEAKEDKKDAPIDPALKAELEGLYEKLEAAGVRPQVLDHLQEAFFWIDPDAAQG